MRQSLRRKIRDNPAFYITGLSLVTLLSIVALVEIFATTRYEVDWLNETDWSHFTGAEQTDSGIKITPTNRVINHSDTSTAQPNPPVNIRGSYVKVSGDFKISMDISGVDNEATVQLYGQIPVIFDEWRQERQSIRLSLNNDQIYVQIWDGSAQNSIDERRFETKLMNEASLALIHQNDSFIIQANGKSLGSIPDHKIFADGKIWFGADAKPNSPGWTLKSLIAGGLDDKPVELVGSLSLMNTNEDPNTLRKLSEKNARKMPIGAAISIGPLLTDERYNKIALSQFGMMTPENSFKPQFIHPEKDLYLFNEPDTLVEAALNNKMVVHGHALVMGKANPEWMQKTPENERKQVMIEHINTVIGHYKGKVAQWDVVNEPLSVDDIDYSPEQKGIRKQMWFDAMGEEYIDIAYKTARGADPSAKLFLNDFGVENDGQRWDALLALVKRLQDRGVPIDGVGFESHVYHTPADTINPAELKKHIQALAAIGVESRISEIDVLGDDPVFQAKQYAEVLQVCLSEPTCTSYNAWGITDLYGSTTLSDRYPIVLGDSLLWDKDYAPKAAFKSLQTILAKP